MYVCRYVHINVCMYVHMYVCMYAYVCMYVYVHTYVRMCMDGCSVCRAVHGLELLASFEIK